MNRLWIILFVIPAFLLAQESYFESVDNLKEIDNPADVCLHSFVWRSSSPKGFQYVSIDMNNLLYQSKKAYRWPRQASLREKTQIRLTDANAEILFTSSLVLSDDDSLTALVNGRLVPLRKISRPGLLKIRSPQVASIQDLQAQDPLQNIQQLPVLIESTENVERSFIVSAMNFVPQVLRVEIQEEQFQSIDVRLEPLPRFQLPVRSFEMDSLKNLQNDSLKLVALDSLLGLAERWQQEDSIEVANYKLKILGMVTNQDIGRNLRELTLQNAMDLNGLVKSMKESMERIQLLTTYRQEIMSGKLARERLKQRNPQAQMIRKYFHRRIFAGVSGVVGRNLPKVASNPGPDQMWGVNGSLSWVHMYFSRLLIEPRLDGLYSSWHFNQDVKRTSWQSNGGASVLMNVPLLIAPSTDSLGELLGGSSIILGFGPSLQVRNTHVKELDGYQNELTYTIGSSFQLTFSVTKLPLLIFVKYGYYRDQFGDLLAGFSIPLGRLL